MDDSVIAKSTFKLTPTQATLISFFVMFVFMLVSLVIFIGYRDSMLGLAVVGGVVAGVGGIAIVMRPQLGAYLLIITLFTNMSSIFTDSGWPSINKPLVVFVLGGIVVNRVVNKRPFPKLRQVELMLLALGFVWLLSSFFATDRVIALDRVLDFIKDFVIVLLFVMALETFRNWQHAIWLLILTALLLAAMSSYQILSGDFAQTFMGFSGISQEQVLTDVYQVRLTGPLDDPNFYGLILVTAVPLAVYYFLDEKRLVYRILAGITTLLLVLSLLNTYSRGAFVALLVILLLIAIERRVSPKLLLGIGVAVFLLMPLLPGNFTDRMSSLLDLGSSAETAVYEESSFRGRTSEYISGMLMFTDNPILGVGVRNYPLNYQLYSRQLGLDSRTEQREPHSLYIEVLAETGLVGIIVFTALVASLMNGIRQARKKLQIMQLDPAWRRDFMALQMSLIAFLVGSIFLHGAYIRYLWLLVALIAAGIHLTENAWEKRQQSLENSQEVAV